MSHTEFLPRPYLGMKRRPGSQAVAMPRFKHRHRVASPEGQIVGSRDCGRRVSFVSDCLLLAKLYHRLEVHPAKVVWKFGGRAELELQNTPLSIRTFACVAALVGQQGA